MGLSELRNKLARGEARVAGVLSGTSADGIDVALVQPAAEALPDSPAGSPAAGSEGRAAGPSAGAPARLLGFETRPFPAELARRVRAVLDGCEPGLAETARLHRDLGRAFGAAARDVARSADVALDLVGCLGQTVWHHDGRGPGGPASLQLGDGDFAAEAAGCAVVSDFRQRDLAAGGQGAPIAALVDDELFAGAARPCAVLNLGGIANLTFLGERGAPARSFDTGPAGSLLDGLARRLLDRPYDDGGRAALAGAVHPELVRAWLAHPYFAQVPPKSTGRDTFGEAWVDELAAGASSLPAPDLLASAASFVAAHVADALRRFAEPASPVWVAGGGVHNAAVMAALGADAAGPVRSSAACGVDPDAREAVAFALLAARCVLERPSTQPEATGARGGRVLGKLSLAAWPAGGRSADGATP